MKIQDAIKKPWPDVPSAEYSNAPSRVDIVAPQ